MPLAVVAGAALVVQVVGAIKAGNAAKKQGALMQEAANDQAALSDYNASVADLQATDATQRGAEEESRFRTQVKSTIATQRTGFAAGNIDVGYGSAADVQADAAYLGELDALTIRTNAAREAWGFQADAYDLRTRADIQRKSGVMQAEAGRQAQTASRYQAAGTLVGGAATLLQAKYGAKK